MTSDKGKVASIGSNRLEDRLASDATHVYSLRAECVYSSSSEKCLLLMKHDQIVVQMNHMRMHKGQDIRRGRLNNETQRE